MKLAFVDTETTGLDPHYHEVWEAAFILVNVDQQVIVENVMTWQIPVRFLDRLDPDAAAINGFNERYGFLDRQAATVVKDHQRKSNLRRDFYDWCQDELQGRRICSCNVTFDVSFLRETIKSIADYQGTDPQPTWHYSPIDIKSLCYGHQPTLLGARTEDLIKAAGLPAREGHHTALEDVELALDLFRWVQGSRSTTALDKLRADAVADARNPGALIDWLDHESLRLLRDAILELADHGSS